MARVVQRDEVTVDDSLIQPNQQDQCRFHKHRDYPSDKLGIVLTLKLAKSLEYRFVEHGNTAAFLHHVPCHRLVPLLMLLEPKQIGRASCRERVEISVVAVTMNK